MSETAKVTVVSPDGQKFVGQASDLAKYKAMGFRELNDIEREEDAKQEKYGGVAGKVGAAVSGVASGLTFGGSDLAIQQGAKSNTLVGNLLKPVQEANQSATEINPGYQTAGQAVSLAVPFAGELAGASAAGKVARGAGAGINAVGKGSQLVGDVAGAIAPKAIAPIARAAAQGATEGAAFQIGTNIGGAARRDVPLDAETVLAHAGEASLLGGGLMGALPVAGKVAKWTAGKALDGLEGSVQALRAAGVKVGELGIDAVDAGVAAAARNADNIGEGVARVARGTAGVVDDAAGAIVNRVDDIGAAAEGAARKVTGAVDEHLLPKIRQGLTEQTGRADIIDDVFASTPEARALREQLGNESLTGARKHQAQQAGRALDKVWEEHLDTRPMFDDIALGVKRDLQGHALADHIIPEVHKDVFYNVLGQGQKALDAMGGASTAQPFKDALAHFGSQNFERVSDLYAGIDKLKAVAGRFSQIEKRASSASGSSGLAADAINEFRGFTRTLLEDSAVWGEAGALQRQVNAAYTRLLQAEEGFAKQFAAPAVKGRPTRVLDGAKKVKWARDIAGQAGDVRNAVIDDLVDARRDMIELTEQLAQKASRQNRELLASGRGGETVQARAAAAEAAPEVVTDALASGRANTEALASSKAAARKVLDRAEVLQGAQNQILSRQGAGVNPLPVELMRQVGGGALVGGAIGGLPGAIIGGGLTSALQKYGAITSNPKSAIDFLNSIDRLRKVEKDRVASWIKSTLGETSEAGIRGGAKRLADKVNPSSIADAVRKGSRAVQESTPAARSALASANKNAARKILGAREAAQSGLEAVGTRMNESTPDLLRRILPAVSYVNVQNGSPQEWWARTQRALINAQTNPDAVLQSLEDETDSIASDLPEMADAIAKQKLRVLSFLADKMPRNPRAYMLGDPKWTPDPTQMKSFRDVVLVATQPDTLLPLISSGLATRAQVDAVKELWPKTFANAREDVVGAVMKAAEDGAPVSYDARIRLGQLLGVPLDPSQERGFYQWLQRKPQKAGAAPATPGAPPQAPPPQGINLHVNTGAMMPQTTTNANSRN